MAMMIVSPGLIDGVEFLFTCVSLQFNAEL